MRGKITQQYPTMPQGANVGDERDFDDSEFATLQGQGFIERVADRSAERATAGNLQTGPSRNAQPASQPASESPGSADERASNQRAEYERVNAQTERREKSGR